MQERRVGAAVLAFAGVILSAGSGSARGQVFPGVNWRFRPPAEVGLDESKLDQVAAIVAERGCIVRNGYMVKSWGSQSTRGDWASASKPVITTLLFYAIEEGRIPSVDALVKDHGWSLIPKDQALTFRHMANMMGTYTLIEPPGTVWAYSDLNIQLYQMTLFDHVYGQSADSVALAPSRLGGLQFEDGSLFNSRPRVATSVRDFARIGWFWLNRGNWNGVQLLPRQYFDEYMKPHVPPGLPRTSGVGDLNGDYLGIGSYGGGPDQTPYGPGIYGFNWWFNAKGGIHPDSKTWPDAPDDTFQANGHWGREVCVVMPGLKLVMTYWRSVALDSFEPGNASSTTNQVLRLLKESVRAPDQPLISVVPAQIDRKVEPGVNLAEDVFTVENAGSGTLQYRIEDDQPWLSAAPVTGSSVGEQDAITITYDVAQLPVGTHHASIEVHDDGSSPAALGSSMTLSVNVVVETVLPDFDWDADVDQHDFGFLQVCFTTPAQVVSEACLPADMNHDSLVNQVDADIFLACMSGTNVFADKACDNAYE